MSGNGEFDDDKGGPSIPADPELEKALREAADAIPDHPKRRAAPPQGGDGEAPAPGAHDDPATDEELDRLRKELAAAGDRLVRHQADFENFRKRAMRERQESQQYGGQNLVKDLVSVVDNLDRAVEHAQHSEGGDLKSLLQGVELVQREFLAVLAKHNIHEIEADGRPFDPNVHEAMAQAPSASVPPNTVVSVFQKGYQLHDRLIRPARVVVAKAADPVDGEGETGSS
jgi:molecular chaperone GrpE